jgi:O-methyltransferase
MHSNTSVDTLIGRTASIELYLDMIKQSLTDSIYWDDPIALYTFYRPSSGTPSWKRFGAELLETVLSRYRIRLVKPHTIPGVKDSSRLSKPELAEIYQKGGDWPVRAHTMIGLQRLDNLQFCVETVINDGIPGDLIETGVWRGGACIFMRAILKAYGENTRTVWVADSFAGLPLPNVAAYSADAGDEHHTYHFLGVSQQQVEENFRRYNLLDRQVRFLKGWFKDSLPDAPIDRLAVLRLDGDMYESTTQALESLYHKVSSGGFIIIDDYFLGPCREAVTDFRLAHHIDDPIIDIDGRGVFWRRAQR